MPAFDCRRNLIWQTILLNCLLLLTVVTPARALDEAESLQLLTETLQATDDSSVQAALMRGMLRGMEGRRQVQAPKGWYDLSKSLSGSSDKNVRELSNRLSQIFGDVAAMKRALQLVRNQKAPVDDRRSALRSLLNQKNEAASSLLESLLDEPDMALDAIRGYAVVENPTAPGILLGRYAELDSEHRRVVVQTLTTRKRYAEVLLRAIENEQVAKNEVPAQVARSLNDMFGDRFIKVFGEFRQLAADREKQIQKYKNILTAQRLAAADASAGRAVYKKTCAACHLLYGDGGKVGPDLTGSNRANLDYILLNSIDPSYDVPDGYKMVSILTNDGRVVNGVLAEEDSSRIVLKTAEQPRVVIAKNDIDTRKISSKSMMPDGQLQQLKRKELVDLIKYLQTTEQVEIAK